MAYRSHLSLAVVVICVFLLSINILGLVSADEADCTNCTPPPNNGSVASAQQSSWPAGATVRVYIDPAFAQIPGAVQAIQDAFTNWSNAAGSGVTFQFSSTPVSGQNTYTVNRQEPSLGPGFQGETGGQTSGGHRYSAFSNLNPGVTLPAALTQAMAHELGHTFGLGDAPGNCQNRGSAMNLAPSLNDTTRGADGPTNCDSGASAQYNNYGATPTPSPTPPPTSSPTPCPNSCANWRYELDPDTCDCVYVYQYNLLALGDSPIVIDTLGNGFDLTNAANGVSFDLNSNGLFEHIAWTAAQSDDAWLALDRNGNGKIDDGTELFGDLTLQPITPSPNGFIALAEFDKPENGGNNDGIISENDYVFGSLLLWLDKNHDGVSQSAELRHLIDLDLKLIELDYKISKRTDSYGNQFRYRAKIKDTQGAQLGRWAWDVFLAREQ